MTTGSEFADVFRKVYDPKSEAQPAREKIILDAVTSGKTPSWFRDRPWPEYTFERLVAGKNRSLVLRIAPFLAIGEDADWIMPPIAPSTLQSIATYYHSILPSTRIVTDQFLHSEVRVPLQVPGPPLVIPGPDMWSVDAFVAHSKLVRDKCGAAIEAGKRVSGHSKDVVCGPKLTAANLAIFGGFTGMIGPKTKPTDPPQVDGWAFQSYPGPHPAGWVDYSQCGRVVFRRARLDGQEVDVRDLFLDPELHVLVSSQGPFDPTYPNEPPRGQTVGSSGSGSGSTKTPAYESSKVDADTGSKIAIVLGGLALAGLAAKKLFG